MPAVLPDRDGRLCLVRQGADGTFIVEHRDAVSHENGTSDDTGPCRRAMSRHLRSPAPAMWQFGDHRYDLTGRVLVMGIVNCTPDSFYDGGIHGSAARAVDAAVAMIDAGADIVDVGGESTRPGAAAVSPDEEARRVLPVIEALAGSKVPVSIDTRHAEVARVAIEAGAAVVNDVSGFRNPAMVDVAAATSAGLVIMHMQGEPHTMQIDPQYGWVTGEVACFLGDAMDRLVEAGVAESRIVVDPGIGFGKTLAHNLELLRSIGSLLGLGRPVMVGVSRKSFIGQILGLETSQRLEGSLAAASAAVLRGARILRVHDVVETVRLVRVLEHLL